MGAAYTPDTWDAWTARMKDAHGNGNGHGASLHIEALRMLPTPTTEPTTGNGHARNLGAEARDAWGDYAPAIARWERLTRPAPAPTEPTGKGGAHRLSPRFVEWMMCLPAGWVDAPGVGRNAQLEALGNGVVPQQATAAITHLLDVRDGLIGEAAA